MEQLGERLLNWASILEPRTREQVERASAMSFIYPHLALMADAHLGKAATVGWVIPMLGAIMPAAVGVDLGCGTMAVRTQFTADDAHGHALVLEGNGNRLALNSSPHGAGREYSRTAARKKFTRAELDAAMQGIEWRHTNAFLDEIPGACKDVDVVMAGSGYLVEIKHTLRQIVNVKAD
jgi:tRNA-splicing ligase RtcB (3'-phosphate/5'-hydroxy nucleic acid ligase)